MHQFKRVWINGLVKPIDLNLMSNIYYKEIKKSNYNSKKLMDLELSQYLENYLWPNFDHEFHGQNIPYLMSIIIMFDEKFKEKVEVWQIFQSFPQQFGFFFNAVTKLALKHVDLTIRERLFILIFFINSFSSLEIDLVREQLAKYVSPAIWMFLSETKRQKEILTYPKLKKYFKQLENKDVKLSTEELNKAKFERSFLFNYTKQFLQILNTIPEPDEEFNSDPNKYLIIFCERFLEYLIDLESVSPTRRFFNAILDEQHVVVFCEQSNLFKREIEGKLFRQLLKILKFYVRFEINDMTSEELTLKDISKKHYEKMAKLQKIIYKEFPQLKEFYLTNVSKIDLKKDMIAHLSKLSDEELINLAIILNYGTKEVLQCMNKQLILEIITFHHEKFISQLDALNEMPLFPTEKTIWDENLVPVQYYNSESCLALPKLNIQFLTLHDYLLRNIHLFRLESTYEIRQDIESSISRMKPWKSENGELTFGGWARMALPIDEFTIVEVAKPRLGEKAPSRVRAEVKVALSVRNEIKKEWQSLRKHDVCFLINVKPPNPVGTTFNFNEPFCPQVGLTYVRGCEIEGMLDSQGKIIEEGANNMLNFETDYRVYRVWLNNNQYAIDQETIEGETIYDSFNIILRRKPKENNFKAVLETIKELMNTKCVVPEWIHDIILGYGDPASAHHSEMPNLIKKLNFNDTFLSVDHVKKSFLNFEIEIKKENQSVKIEPPFTLEMSTYPTDEESSNKIIKIISNKEINRGPYLFTKPRKNKIEFTPTQIEGIYSGMQHGLTVIVGPPGTGKTDVAVQIISNLYHNFPNQRILIVTHSNQALNQLFEKIMALDVDERHLLRLGHGEEELDTEKDFSRYGRVNYVLSKRLELLNEVGNLAKSLNIPADVGYTCETASFFYLHHILSRWESFTEQIELGEKNKDIVEKIFPFSKYFENAPQPLFYKNSFEDNLEIAKGCFRYLKKIFTQLEEFKAFEMLRSNSDRSNYLLIKEAKIIAMTCTHAALKRKELVNIGFQYDTILMEEAAQILEIETFIPLLLQNPEHGHNRLKRWIMIGDHNQLPPVIKNRAFQKYSNMEQSLFARFVRLCVPTVTLNAQGRSRSSLCSLFRWRYKTLQDLPHVLENTEYLKGNAGFAFDYQFINVEDFNGVGESEPMPYFYQNLAEAEFAVAQFMYMRLLGYPYEKITILTTYNGQKHLIRDVIEQRCASNPFIGKPSKITTVDKFQGMQNDYIILSLVRTKNVGHIRDVRRLIVAMSRAKLGLYIYGRLSVFDSCAELKPVFDQLKNRSNQLCLLPNETYPCEYDLNSQERKLNSKTIPDMQKMVQFVYEFYENKIEDWKKNRPELIEKVLAKKTIEPEEEKMEYEVIEEENQENGEAHLFEKLTEKDTGLEDKAININDSGDDDD